MEIDESLLTGESVPVDKHPASAGGEAASNAFSGTVVVRGEGLAEVTATGARTEIGKIGQSLRGLGRETPRLSRQIRKLVRVVAARDRVSLRAGDTPVLVKIAPDLTLNELDDVVAVARKRTVDGMIVGNTTIARPRTLRDAKTAHEAGGLSGRPLFAPSTALLAEMYRLTQGRLPLIGVGGIASAEDAYAKIRAGASLVQLYSALVFAGPDLVSQIKSGLASLLRRDGFDSITEAVGTAQGAAPVTRAGSVVVP